MEEEIHKMLGASSPKGEVKFAEFDMVASAPGCPVIDGHLESAVLKHGEESPTPRRSSRRWRTSKPEPQKLELPTAPIQPIIVRREENRPQPAVDVYAGEPARARGMAVTVGRVRQSGKIYQDVVAFPQHPPGRGRRFGAQRGTGQGQEAAVR